MFKSVDQQKVPLTLDLVRRLLEMKRWKGERNISRARLAMIRSAIDDGRYHSPYFAIARLNGMEYGVNGQHSVRELAAKPEVFPQGLSAFIEIFTCNDLDDLALLFAQFDPKTSSRNRREIVNAHIRTHEELDSVSATKATVCAGGIAFAYSDGHDSRSIGDVERAQTVHQYPEFILWAKDFVGQRSLQRTGVVAAMFLTFNRDRNEANTFWSFVREESHPDNNHPSRKLGRLLREHSIGRRGRHGIQKWPARAYYVKSIHAWNAYRKNGGTDLGYHEKAPTPKVL